MHLTSVPGGRAYDEALAWVDRTHVATMRQSRTGLVYDVVDVRTGVRRQLTSKPCCSFTLAADALRTARTVPGIAPPSPWNPRWVSLVVLIAVAGIAGAVLVARRLRGRA
ncbi:MAG: hypothetical protein J2P22_12800 [Nocardioides sp.]|nr:hypothetical protein [Nocardioides sp.]